ncbi:hypothetical protein PHYPSEUDO_010925 [Phytophthora pseudosyringae]|uniref:Uncharacterized protein n=1 Tax=Phytophthora pseudosyringae TaxID=221518 RepID=A0A8T1VCG2_9STRA|nr:hypothetical protein PHYPSEUDO_010925 [Phytophthora pseudosyringae]
MWVVDLGICAIHMDNKPNRFPPTPFHTREPSSSDQQNDSSDQQASDGATDGRPKKRSRRVVDSSITCAPEQLHCRYANKTCLNPRAVKRTGGLHTFCAMHRANANRNQRRLDMRKRMARQALRAQAEAGQASPTPSAVTPPQQAAQKTEAIGSTLSPTGEYAQYEPLHTPTPLQEEDISTLVALFLPPMTTQGATFGFQLDAPMTPTTPHDWSSSTSTGRRTPPPPPPGGMRF